MTAPLDRSAEVSVLIVPRERYSPTAATLRAVLETVPADVGVVVVRGGMPARIEAEVEAVGGERVQLVGPARHLAPNAARRLGLRATTTRYVAMLDNDVVPHPGWLGPLLRTAAEHDAWVVRPLVLQTTHQGTTVHDAGGDCRVDVDDAGRRTLQESHRHMGDPVEDVAHLRTEPVELFEFHAALVDRARIEAVGGPDEALLAQGEHLDLALRIHDAGGTVWLEPASVVGYPIPERLALGDLSFFLGRWSPSWIRSSRRHFNAVHNLDDEDRCFTWGYPQVHRAYAWLPLGRAVQRATGRSTPMGLARRFDTAIGGRLADAALRLDPSWRRGPTV